MLNELRAPHGARHRKKRVGRGQGSGTGKTAGRGGKGQKARTGNMNFEGFEGGQTPLQRRLPKFGFKSVNRTVYGVVNLDQLDRFAEGSTIDEATLRESGLVKGSLDGVKVLGRGSLDRKLTVKVHKVSEKAREAIEKAGGTIEVVPLVEHAPGAVPPACKKKGEAAASKPDAQAQS